MLLELLYIFMSTSKAHTIYIEQHSTLNPTKPIRQLQHLSDTWWACRYAVCSTIDLILVTLQSTINGDNRVKATEASGIYSQIHSFKFLMTLIIFWKIL